MQFQHLGRSILLHGLQPFATTLQVDDRVFKGPSNRGLILQITILSNPEGPDQLLPEINDLISNFPNIFATPTGMPSATGMNIQST